MNYTINDNEETITCRLCGEQCKRIYGVHMRNRHKGITTDDYRKMFPGAPIASPLDKMSTSKNSGKHMKDEKYKKMFSEMISGENNPNHKTRTTETERKKRSPFSKEFVKYEDIENVEEHISKFAKEAIKDRVGSTTIEYFINKGYSEEEAQKMLSERQRTFSLEKCIEKFGIEKGKEVWQKRQEKWLRNYKSVNYSQISQDLFINLYNKLNENDFNENVYFARLNPETKEIHNENKNYEYRLKLEDSYILPDFFIPSLKLIIEFDGTYYHRNTSENKTRERQRNRKIRNSGYQVIHIKEIDYVKNKEKTINSLIKTIQKIKTHNV
jgi:hypothetical protein